MNNGLLPPQFADRDHDQHRLALPRFADPAGAARRPSRAPGFAITTSSATSPTSAGDSWFADDGDGVVSLASARLDNMPQLRSQIVVPADHVNVHRHPQSILEVRRVLLEQLAELENFPGRAQRQLPQRFARR